MKVQNPIIGRARGSAGGMTFCKNYDKNVARAKAFEVSNPKTQAQQTQRAFFAELTALCSDFSDEDLRVLFPNKPKSMSRRNALAKQIATSYEVNGTEKTIDYSDIDTLGNAPVMDFGVTTAEFDNVSVVVTLDENVSANVSLANLMFIAYLVNETKGEIVRSDKDGTVSEGTFRISIPTGWEDTDTIHAIPLIMNMTQAQFQQGGFGTLAVTKRPVRKND